MKYIHLVRNKWLKIKPEKIENYYFKGEQDDKGKYVEDVCPAYRFNEIIISTTDPNRRDSIKNHNTNRYDCQVQG